MTTGSEYRYKTIKYISIYRYKTIKKLVRDI